jgi:hypothetical protein
VELLDEGRRTTMRSVELTLISERYTVESAKKKSVSSRTGAEPSRRAQRYHQQRLRVRRRVIALVGVGLGLIAVVLVVVVFKDDATTPPYDGTTLDVILGDYTIIGNLTAPAGGVRLRAVNQGGIVHNVGVRRGPISGNIQPKKTLTIDLGVLAPGTYELYCDLVDPLNHVEEGMVAPLIITEPSPITGSTAVATS